MRIRLSGQGEVGPGGGPAGDLYVEISEQPHDVFIREGADLHCTVAVPMTAAALGTDLVLETLDGEEKLEIRAGHAERRCRHAARQGRAAAAQRRRAATCTCTSRYGRRPSSTTSRSGCCASSPPCATRTSRSTSKGNGLFGKMRDAFGGR